MFSPKDTSITIYTKSSCIYCQKAKQLLKTKQVPFEEIDINTEPERRKEMLRRSNGKTTVPQIFIHDKHIGGYDDLAALEKLGQLDDLLGGL